MNCWQTLGLEPTNDKRAIKRAYAKLLKQNNPEEFPAEFQALREAYDLALTLADSLAHTESDSNREPTADSVDDNNNANDPREPNNSSAPTTPLSLLNNTHELFTAEQTDHTPQPIDNEPEIIAEKEAIFLEQTARIESVLQELLPLVNTDTQGAIEYCQTLLQQEYFTALDVREELEGRLVQALANQPMNFAFSDYLARAFEWDIDLTRIGQVVNPPFTGNNYQSWFYYFIEPYVLQLMKNDVARYLEISPLFRKREDWQHLLSLLFSDEHHEEIEAFCKKRSRYRLLNNLYNYLQIKGFVGYNYSLISYQKEQFLIKKQLVEVNAVNEWTTPHPPPNTDANTKSWAASFGVIALFILLFFVFSELNTTNFQSLGSAQSNDFANMEAEAVVNQAELGNTRAQRWLGLRYLLGDKGYRQNTQFAKRWLTEAAEHGDAQSQYTLGQIYYSGIGVERDYQQATLWLKQAHDHGVAAATLLLSEAYRNGLGVDKNIQRANQLLRQAARDNYAPAQTRLGRYSLYGVDVPKDLSDGFYYLRTASSQNHYPANRVLFNEYVLGLNAPLDYQLAFLLLEQIPEDERTSWDLFWMSLLIERGLGTQQLPSYAETLYQKALNKADDNSINNFAWSLATHANTELHDGARAIALMEPLVAATTNDQRQWMYEDTLAAAYARNGDFTKAVDTQLLALANIPNDVDTKDLQRANERLKMYRNNQAFHFTANNH